MMWSWASFAIGMFTAAPVMLLLLGALHMATRETEAVIVLPGKSR